jgi:asparaginyl-tRNA synthetase
MEFLRQWMHWRPRSNIMSALLRIRHSMVRSLRNYYDNMGCIEIHTPILTSIDCEGAGETFRLAPTTYEKQQQEFFDRPVYLTVSGQLHLEAAAAAFKRVYALSPIFRAEHTDTSRHLAEFWMFEVELAFLNELSELVHVIEKSMKSTISDVMKDCSEDLQFLNQRFGHTLLKRLESTINQSFIQMDYSEAIRSLQQSNQTFSYPVTWQSGLQTEHEKYLAGPYSNYTPVFVMNYPTHLKAFYMRENEGADTVAAIDLLVPTIGELAGGSLRETCYHRLKKRIHSVGLNEVTYEWYLDLRKYGSAPHGGFGIGIERFLRYLTGLENVRDVIPFPRYVHHCPL